MAIKGYKILITRPEAQAAEFIADACTLFGLSSADFIRLPLLDIGEITLGQKIQDMDRYSGVVVTSSHAMLSASDYLGVYPDVPFFRVGKSTISAEGLAHKMYTAPDVCALARVISGYYAPCIEKTNLIYFSGADVRYDLQALLGDRFDISRKIVYEAFVRDDYTSSLDQIIHNNRLGAVMLFSRRTADAFFLACKRHYNRHFTNTVFLCISDDVAHGVPPDFKRQIAVTPDRDGMLELVRRFSLKV